MPASPGRKIRPRIPYNLALFSATVFLMLFAPSFQRVRHRKKNGRFPDSFAFVTVAETETNPDPWKVTSFHDVPHL